MTTTKNKPDELDTMLLKVRSDEYGDTGNYYTPRLKQAINQYIYNEVKSLVGDGKNDSPHNYDAHLEREIFRTEILSKAEVMYLKRKDNKVEE